MREPGRLSWRVLGALAGWAAMTRVVGVSGIDSAMGNRAFLARAMCEGLAGCGLLGWAAWRRQRMPAGRGWVALPLLAGVAFAGELLWRPYIDGVLRVHYLRAPLEGMVLLVAPLWLALLAGFRVVPDAVPRRTVGAALVGLAAYCLILEEAALMPRLEEAPALLLCWMYALATVWAWSYARRVFAGGRVTVTAGAGLLVLAVVHSVAAASVPNDVARLFAWKEVWGPLALGAVATGVGGWLWYWLLLRVELAIFSMQALVLWLSAVAVAFTLFGFLSWRVDLSLGLGVGAVLAAVQARVEDDEPVRLGVSQQPPR